MKLMKIFAVLVVQFHLIVTLNVKVLSEFPLVLNSIFKIQIQPNHNEKTLAILAGDTMLIQIRSSSGLMKQREIFHFGIKDSIEKAINGNFMKIKKWEINYNASAIDLFIIFDRNSNFHLFEIYFIDAQSKELLKKKMNDLSLAQCIYQNKIQLFYQSTLSLTVNSSSKNQSDWRVNDTIVAICQASNGIPNEIPKFQNYQIFNYTSSTFSLERNEIKINLRIQKVNHMAHLNCTAGTAFKIHTIRVLHHPTELFIEPEMNFIMKPNSTLQCYVKDGFPLPKIEWNYIEGPINSSNYYEISRNGSNLLIRDNCPNNSRWKFSCNLTHVIGNSSRKLFKTVLFFVDDAIRLCNNDCLLAKLLDLEFSTRKINQLIIDDKINQLRIVSLEKEHLFINNEIYRLKKEFNFSNSQSKMEDQILHDRINLLKNQRILSNILLSMPYSTNKSIINSNLIYKIFISHIDKIVKENNKLKADFDAFKQNKTNEIDKLKMDLKSIQNQINDPTKGYLSLIIKYILMDKNINSLENKIFRNFSQLQNDFKELKAKNTALKHRLKLLENIQRGQDNKLRREMTEFQKNLESKFLKEIKLKARNCINNSNIGKVETNGREGQIHEWKIYEFTKLPNNKKSLFSPAFYSYHWGYNMRLKIDIKFPTNTSIGKFSLNFQLIPGEFDSHQRWPMEDFIELSVENTINRKAFFQKQFSHKGSLDNAIFKRPSCEGNPFTQHSFTLSKDFHKVVFLTNDTLKVYCKVLKNIS